MAYTAVNWKAREGVNLNKFTKAEETATSVVLINAPDKVNVPGTPISVENLNRMDKGISDAHERIDAKYGTVEMLMFQPTVLELAQMRLLPLEGQVITIATYQRLCDRMYVGNAKNATAEWWYKISNPNDINSRSTSGAYMVVLDGRAMFWRGAGVNAVYKCANDSPLFIAYKACRFFRLIP